MNRGIYQRQKELTDERRNRLACIKGLIEAHQVSTQKQLVDLLHENGIFAVQSTVSRDIQELQLQKNRDGYYVLPNQLDIEKKKQDLEEILSAHAVEIDEGIRLLGIKTLRGYSQPVAQRVEDAYEGKIFGTITGAETVLVLAKNDTVGNETLAELHSLFHRNRENSAQD